MLRRFVHGTRKLSETRLLHVDSRLLYHAWTVIVMVSAGSVDVWTKLGSYNVWCWMSVLQHWSASELFTECLVMMERVRTFVEGFYQNKVHSKVLDVLCLNMHVVAGNSRWKIQYRLVQVFKHLGYKNWNMTDPKFLCEHLTFLETNISTTTCVPSTLSTRWLQ